MSHEPHLGQRHVPKVGYDLKHEAHESARVFTSTSTSEPLWRRYPEAPFAPTFTSYPPPSLATHPLACTCATCGDRALATVRALIEQGRQRSKINERLERLEAEVDAVRRGHDVRLSDLEIRVAAAPRDAPEIEEVSAPPVVKPERACADCGATERVFFHAGLNPRPVCVPCAKKILLPSKWERFRQFFEKLLP